MCMLTVWCVFARCTECYDVYVNCLVCICQVCCFAWEDEDRPVTPSRVQSVKTCMLTVWCVFARCVECYDVYVNCLVCICQVYDVYVNWLVCICQVYRVLRRVC